MNTPESSIPLDLLQSAQCIAIIPSEVRFAFIFEGNHGKGLVTCRVGEVSSYPDGPHPLSKKRVSQAESECSSQVDRQTQGDFSGTR